MNKYTLVNNETNNIENIIIWDGATDLGELSGYTLYINKETDAIGEQYVAY